MDPDKQKMVEHLRRRIGDLKAQLAFHERPDIAFWRREAYGPRIEMKFDWIKHLKRCIVDTERRLAQAEKGW
jgi:hypothetical protein